MRHMGKLLTPREASERLGLKISTIRRMILERRIDTVRPGARAVRIPEDSVNRILIRGFAKAIGHSDGTDSATN